MANVNYHHSEYSEYQKKHQKMRDVIEGGEEVIKAAGTVYVPKLTKQTAAEYKAYVARGNFYAATGRTAQGLHGAIFRKPPVVEYPKPDALERVTLQHDSIAQLSSNIMREVLCVGRVGVLTEPSAPMSYFVPYKAENIINWRSVRTSDGELLVLVVLEEVVHDYSENPYEPEEVTQYRVLKLNQEGLYVQEVYVKDKGPVASFILVATIYPEVNGRKMEYIPFKFFNPDNLLPSISNPPLNALANLNLSHWRTTVDLHEGLHYTALPIYTAAGVPASSEFLVGSRTAWTSTDPTTRFGILEYVGTGLGAVSGALKEMEGHMAVLGARILEASKAAVEAAATLGIRKSTEDSILAQIANNVSEGITELLKLKHSIDYFVGADDISFALNTDYNVGTLDPAALTALVLAWQDGGMSSEALLYNLKRGELQPASIDTEEEVARLEAIRKPVTE